MKKLFSVMAILLAVALFPISFSGSQTSSVNISTNLVLTEGGSITINAGDKGEGATYRWTLQGLMGGGTEECNAATAAKYGVEFSGGTTSTLTIKNINANLNNKFLICYSVNKYKFGGNIYYKLIQVQEYKPVTPTISTIQSVTANKNEECKLTAIATSSDGGTLSYQWYEASAENTKEITPISGAAGSTFTCDTTKGGTRYYLCKVINTKKGKSNDAFSNVASVTVSTPVPTPEYNTKKISILPDENVTLKAAISLSESERGKISYQWYESAKDDPDEAKAISGATSDTITINGSEHSGTTRYYFCKITNEINGEKYTSINDEMTMVEVAFAGQHIHEYGEWKVTAEPTCTEDGTKTRTCECGDKQTEVVSALGHDFGEWTAVTEATADQEGLEERSCTRCGSTETRTIPVVALQSIENASAENTNAPTSDMPNATPWWIFAVVGGVVAVAVIWFLTRKKNRNQV